MNEVGTRDAWPAIAESVTWGYGSAGSYGFRRPRVRDRWHSHAGHGYFLDAKFCRKYWIPFLKDGTIVEGAANPEAPPVWLKFLSVIRLKYVALLSIVTACVITILAPQRREAVGALEVPVFTPCKGKIVALFGQIGDNVMKFQTLFTVECPDVLHSAYNLIKAADHFEETRRDLSRLQELSKTQTVSEQELKQAASSDQTAEVDFREARDPLSFFGRSEADINLIISERVPDSIAVVLSPINGRITARAAAPGQLVEPRVPPAQFTVTRVEGKDTDRRSNRQ